MFEGMEKFLWEHSGLLRTLVGSTDTLYHLSPIGGLTQLKPLSKDYSGDIDHQKRSKISLADTIHGCVQALFIPGHMEHFVFSDGHTMDHLKKAQVDNRTYDFYLYAVKTDQLSDTYLACYEMDPHDRNTFDQILTGEVGYRRTLACSCPGMVRVRKLTRAEHEARVKPAAYIAYQIPTMLTTFTPIPVLDFEIFPTGETEITQEFLEKDREQYSLRHKKALSMSIAILHENVDRLSHYYQTGIWKD